jgi:hypothetical protein
MLPTKPNSVGQIGLVQNSGVQFARSKLVDLLSQPETRVTQQKPNKVFF